MKVPVTKYRFWKFISQRRIGNRTGLQFSRPQSFENISHPDSAGSASKSIADKLLKDVVSDTSENGKTLPAEIERRISWYFGVDLSNVWIHSSRAVTKVNAEACASGNHVFFSPESWNPETVAGLTLIGHEIAHLLQQRYRLGACAAVHDRLHQLRCPLLEKQAILAGLQIARLFTGSVNIKYGDGRTLLGLPLSGHTGEYNERGCIQMQEKGILGGFILGGPDIPPPAPAPGVIIFRQTATTNEVHRDRNTAWDRVRLKHNLPSKAQRTYHSNMAHVLNPADRLLGQGTQMTFMQDRALNPVESYGRYYDFGNGDLIVEHTNDTNCRLIEITAVNMVNVSYRRWTVLPHFHMATYPGGQQRYAVNVGNVVNAPPAGYNLAVVPGGHHVYYLSAIAPPIVQICPVVHFNAAFALGAQHVFNLVWPGGGW